MTEREYIMLNSDLTDARLARQLGIGASTVRDARRALFECPSLLLAMSPYSIAKVEDPRTGRRRTLFRCCLCGLVDRGAQNAALRHVLQHFGRKAPWWPDDPAMLSMGKVYSYFFYRRLERRERDADRRYQQELANRKQKRNWFFWKKRTTD